MEGNPDGGRGDVSECFTGYWLDRCLLIYKFWGEFHFLKSTFITTSEIPTPGSGVERKAETRPRFREPGVSLPRPVSHVYKTLSKKHFLVETWRVFFFFIAL